MKRRDFVQLSLLSSLITLKNNNVLNADDKKAFMVRSGQDRYQEELHIMGGQFDCKVSSKDTDGAMLMYDTVRHEKGGPAFHLHHAQDEYFYIIKGEFIIKVG
jgi:mannose-6-phosphate isomerase-like protein (cupin superfamily)